MAEKQNQPAKPATALVKTGTTVLRVPNEWYTTRDDAAVVSTYDLTTTEGRRACFRVLNADCQPAEDWINKEMIVQNVTMHPVELRDEVTGSMSLAVRTICTDAEGNSVSFVSEGITRFFSRLTSMGLPGPWNPPLKLLLKRKQLNGGRSTYTLSEM